MSAFRLTGVLGRHAELRVAPDGTAMVCLEVHQAHRGGGGSIAARAHHCIGKGPAAQYAARNKASQLRAGTRVTVHAAGYTIEQRPSAHLVLLGVDCVEHQPVAPHHEVREREVADTGAGA